MGTSPKFSNGTISSSSGLLGDPRTYQVSVPVQAGNSGGPLFNVDGNVVGVVVSKMNAVQMFRWTGDLPENVSYSIKTSYLKALLENASDDVKLVPLATIDKSDSESLARSLEGSIMMIIGR